MIKPLYAARRVGVEIVFVFVFAHGCRLGAGDARMDQPDFALRPGRSKSIQLNEADNPRRVGLLTGATKEETG